MRKVVRFSLPVLLLLVAVASQAYALTNTSSANSRPATQHAVTQRATTQRATSQHATTQPAVTQRAVTQPATTSPATRQAAVGQTTATQAPIGRSIPVVNGILPGGGSVAIPTPPLALPPTAPAAEVIQPEVVAPKVIVLSADAAGNLAPRSAQDDDYVAGCHREPNGYYCE
jgi:hypothetical protein